MITWYCRVYNQIASDVWRYTIILFISPWRTANKLKLVLIKVLIRSILNTKVLQGCVSTRLMCDGIFNDQFITRSLLSPRVKIFWKSVNISQSSGQLSRGSFFPEHSVYISPAERVPLGIGYRRRGRMMGLPDGRKSFKICLTV